MSTATETAALAEAARTAGFAPSIHNTQPWRWSVVGATLRLHAVRARQLPVSDPVGRLLTISCGAALHHARVGLAAEGWSVQVDRLPDPGDADLLARLQAAGRTPVTREAMRALQAMRVRHTDRRPVSETPVDPDALAALSDAAAAEGARLHLLGADQVIELAAAASHAQNVESLDPGWREELEYWAGGARAAGLGVPDEVIPQHPPETTVAGRDFGHVGGLRVGAGHDGAARYAILFGDEDAPLGWLRGGEALSRLWLHATELGLSVVPLSGVVEVAGTRQELRHLLANLGEPYLGLRVGVADPEHAGPPHTPRLPAEQIVEITS